MADATKKLPGNVDGDFFIDSTCKNCDTCRQVAPTVFADDGRYKVVGHQPVSADERRQALQAIVCCPNGSVGVHDRSAVKEIMDDFPLPIEGSVYYCGFNSTKTAGGNSYFILHPEGNWLVCTPKFQGSLVKRLEALGGIKYIFISHRDDAGDADKFAAHFDAKRIISVNELEAQPAAEIVVEEKEPWCPQHDFLIIPAPGHTEGHLMLLYRNTYLFSGDSLYWDYRNQQVDIWNPYWTWFSFEQQIESVSGLAAYSFEWLLPTHGDRHKLSRQHMHDQIQSAVERARQVADKNPQDKKRWKILNYYANEMRELQFNQAADRIASQATALGHKLGLSTGAL